MDFGHVSHLDGLDLKLPPTPSQTEELLGLLPQRSGPPQLRVGSPRWADPGYLGSLYPRGTRPNAFLRAYAGQLPTIELNATWYRCEFEQNRRWAEQVGDEFRFCPKLPQKISQGQRLRGVEDDVREFIASIAAFGDKLGPAWVLLPSDFGPSEFDALARFVRSWPRGTDLAVELRHPGWFSDPTANAEVFELLESAGISAVITDVAGRRDVLHLRVTTGTTLVRLVGNGLHPTDFERADAWVTRLAEWFHAGLHSAYVFLHQPEEHLNAPVAVHFVETARARCGLDLAVPRLHDEPEQGSLF